MRAGEADPGSDVGLAGMDVASRVRMGEAAGVSVRMHFSEYARTSRRTGVRRRPCGPIVRAGRSGRAVGVRKRPFVAFGGRTERVFGGER